MAYREKPVANRLCTAADRKRDAASHKQRLVSNPPAVDDNAPRTYYLSINRAKKDQMTDEQCEKIDRENRLLLKKMGEIIQSHTLDVVHPSYKRSLNEGIRRREMKKIMQENTAILYRLTERKAHYDREEWAAHRERHGAYLENIREKPIPATPIPLPKFLREGSITQRPAHAYVQGNYSVARLGKTGSPFSSSFAEPSYESGSQSARSAAYHGYYNPTPNRTGMSKHQGGRIHTLQPMPPSGSAKSGAANHTIPRQQQAGRSLQPSNSGINRQLEAQALKAGYVPILQTGKSFGEAYVIVAVHEVPGSETHSQQQEEKQNSSSSATPASSIYISSSHPPPPGHALMFRTYDPLESEDRSVSVPWLALSSLPEVKAKPALLQPGQEMRVELATLLLERLELAQDELRFQLGNTVTGQQHLSSAPSSSVPSNGSSKNAIQPPPASSSSAADSTNSASPPSSSAPILPSRATHPVAYTDSTGLDYYFDSEQNEYLPFPPEPAATSVSTHAHGEQDVATPMTTKLFMQQQEQSSSNTYAIPTQ